MRNNITLCSYKSRSSNGLPIWKQREKQLEKVIVNTVDMYGSAKGIAGNAVASIKALELSGAEEEDE